MKTIQTGILSLLCLLSCLISYSQEVPIREPDLNKPLLFEHLPQKLTCRMNELQSLLQANTGQVININVADNLNLRGVVSSVANSDNGKLISVVIRSTNLGGAVLSFSKITPENAVPYYTGRIISMQHGDCYELTLENGNYVLNKKGFYDMINE